jgi:hypothetical protein
MKILPLSIAAIMILGSHPAPAQQKASSQKGSEKPKYKTYEECVADKKATGWSSTEYGSWCSKNSGR